MSDEELNLMLKINFDLSEQYAMSPYIFLAFAATESDFMKKAVSSAGAKGIVQFMPSTMKLVVGDDYVDDIEFNPVEACRAWYRLVSIYTEATEGDLEWIAAAYMAPIAIQYRNQGKSVKEFMKWIASTTENDEEYPFKIRSLYEEYSKNAPTG